MSENVKCEKYEFVAKTLSFIIVLVFGSYGYTTMSNSNNAHSNEIQNEKIHQLLKVSAENTKSIQFLIADRPTDDKISALIAQLEDLASNLPKQEEEKPPEMYTRRGGW